MPIIQTLTVEQLRVIIADWCNNSQNEAVFPDQVRFVINGKFCEPEAVIKEKRQ